jgi:signal transduction histidine kinase
VLAAVVIFLINSVINSIQLSELEKNNYYNKANIDLSNYKSIDTIELKKNNASIEVIDSNLNIVASMGVEVNEKHRYSKEELFKSLNKPSHELDIKSKKVVDNNGEEYTVIFRQKFTTEQMDQMRTMSIMYEGVFLVCSLAAAVVFMLVFARSVYKPIKEGYVLIQNNISKTPLDKTHVDTSNVYLEETKEVLISYNSMLDEMDKIRLEKQAALSQSNRLISNLSHDLKSPVTILKGYSDILMQGELSREDEMKYFSSINESANHLGELVNILFEQVKFQYSDYSLTLTKVDLNEFLRSTCANYYNIFEKKGFEMEIDIPEEPYFRQIDIVHMKRTFNNILENCLSHNNNPVPVCISAAIENGYYVIRFKDDGFGISDENKEKIFEPFFQENSSRNNRHSGLGLSIAKQVIERHGGTIKLASKKDYKTVFEIRF